MRPFVIFSLPRSRSTWLSAALSAPGRLVGHDVGIDCASISDFVEKITGPYVGTCETGAAFAAPVIKHLVPDVRFVIIRNDPIKVAKRLYELGFGDHYREIENRACQQLIIAKRFRAAMIESDSLCEVGAGKFLCDYLDAPFDPAWWAHMANINIQVDIEATKRKLVANHDRIAALKAEVAEAMASA